MKYQLIVHNKLSIDDCKTCCFSRDNYCKLCTILNQQGQEKPEKMCYDYKRAYFVRLIELSTNIQVL